MICDGLAEIGEPGQSVLSINDSGSIVWDQWSGIN